MNTRATFNGKTSARFHAPTVLAFAVIALLTISVFALGFWIGTRVEDKPARQFHGPVSQQVQNTHDIDVLGRHFDKEGRK